MSCSKNKTAEGRRRNKHSLFANTFDSDTVPWKPRDGIRRRGRVSRHREEIGKQLGRLRQLRSFTSWRDMKKALDSSFRTDAGETGHEEVTEGNSSGDRWLQVRLEPARLSLPPQYEQRLPAERPPLTLLFLKDNDANSDQQYHRLQAPKTKTTRSNGEKVCRLVFNHCQWQQLYSQINEKYAEKEEKEKKAMEILKRKQMSIEMSKTWDNTYINIRRRRYEKRKERLKKEKEYKEKIYKQLKEKSENYKKEMKKKDEERLFYMQDNVKAFHSAFRDSEAQAERKAQIEFNEKLKKIDKEIETKYAESIMNDAKRFKEEQDEELRKQQELKKSLCVEAKKTYAEAEKRKILQQEQRNNEEREDMEIIRRQLIQVIDNERNEALRKKEMAKKSLAENRELVEKNKQLLKLEDEEEDKAIQIIFNGKFRIAKIRAEKEEKLLSDKRNRYKALSSQIQQENQKKIDKEEEIYKRVLDKRNSEELAEIEKQKQYQEMLRNERIQSHLEHIKQEEERLAKGRELLKWEILTRFKKEELNNQFTDKIKDQKKNKALLCKHMYIQQMETDIDRKMKEKEIELEAAKKAQEKWEMNDKSFLEYAYKVREESKNKGRPLYPLDAAIYDFKKRNNLLTNVKNFIYDAKLKRPESIKDSKYEPVFEAEEENFLSCKCSQINNIIQREDCGCAKKTDGL